MTTHPVMFEGLTKWWGPRRVLHGVSFAVRAGQITALLGRNGAGKSTALSCLLGFARPTSGRAVLFGHETTELPPGIRARVGYVSEGERLVPWMTPGQLGEFQRGTLPAFDLALYRSWVTRLRLPETTRIAKLSRGQRAQTALAAVLAARPELVILDDPALGLDAAVRREFLEVMIEMIQEEGRTVLFTSHVLQDVERVADRVAILDDGVLRVDAPAEDLRSRVRRCHAQFGADAPVIPTLPGLVRGRRTGNRWLLSVAGDEVVATTTERCARTAGATAVDWEPLTLEDIFIEFTAPATASPGGAA